MRYVLRHMGHGPRTAIALTKAEYDEGLKARTFLNDALQLVEKLYYVRANFAEWEMEMVRHSVHTMYLDGLTTVALGKGRLEITRRLVNLLTTGLMLVDHARCDIIRIYGRRSQQLAAVEAVFTHQETNSRAYRIMDALRNFAQHQSIPVHGLTESSTVVGRRPRHRLRQICTPYLQIEWIERGGGFGREGKAILKELKKMADKDGLVDLKPLVREYVGSLIEISMAVGKIMKADIDAADKTFEHLLKRSQAQFDDDLGVALAVEDASGHVTSHDYLVPDSISRRKELEYWITVVARMYVSSEADKRRSRRF